MEKVSKKLVNKAKEDIGLGGKGAAKKKKEETKKGGGGDSENEEEEEEVEEVPFEKKVNFTEKVRRLTNEGLTKLVKKVKEVCPQALEDVDD